MPYGDNYSQFLNGPPSPVDPFPHPTNDAQRIANARARAQAAGVDIGSGALNPRTGELQDPDRGLGRQLPWLGPALVGGSALGVGLLGGPFAAGGAGASGAASGVNGVESAIYGGGSGAAAGAGGGLGSYIADSVGGIDKKLGGKSVLGGIGGNLLDTLLSGKGIAGLAGLIATLAARPNGGSAGGDLMSQNPQLNELLTMSADRAKRTDPLHQSITQLAMQRLPTNVQR